MSSLPEFDAELQAFLWESVPSYEHLQSLLLLRGQRDRAFSVASVAELLRIPETLVEPALSDLCRQNLLEVRGGADAILFTYSPANPPLADLADRLAEANERYPLEVMQLMNSNAIRRVRTEALHRFANAFLVGRGKKDG
jgi:hypothetical protein